VLQHWLLLATVWSVQERSLLKGARLLRDELKPLLLALNDREQLEKTLLRLQRLLQKLAQVKARKKDPGHAQLLDDPELLDWLA